MILISFTFLGKDVKVESEGTACMIPENENKKELKEIQLMNNFLMKKDCPKFNEIYNWCKKNTYFETKRKKRETIFVF